MAMEIRRTIGVGVPEQHDGPVLCIAYNPFRREISTGSQDTMIKTWNSESGEFVRTLAEHKGWVTGLAFSPELKVLFSCSIDGRVLVWNKAECVQKEKVGNDKGSSEMAGGNVKGGPLHCMSWDAKRHSLVVGANGHIWVYAAIPEHEMNASARVIIKLQSILKDAHGGLGPENALVRGILSTVSGKLFSVGYDRQLCMWDTDSTRSLNPPADGKKGKKLGAVPRDVPKLKLMGTPVVCHDGAISAMAFDPDNNWVITGSFDRQVKIWAGDSKKPVAVIDEKNGIDDTVTGLAYCPATKTLWMASNSASPIVYDPRSATDITPYLQSGERASNDERESRERIQRLFRIETTGELVGTTSTKGICIWRFNPNGACSILRGHSDWVEVLAHCYKRKPLQDGMEEGEEDSMVLLSAGADSVLRKWEPASRMNPSIYSQTETLAGHSRAVLCALYCEQLDMFITGGDDCTIRLWPNSEIDPNAGSEEADAAGGGNGGGGAKPAGGGAPAQPQATTPPLVLREHSDRVTGLICYGTTIGSVSWDLSIRLWDVHACANDLSLGEEPKSTHVILDAHDDYILSAAYAPELEQLASASADQGVKIWDLTCDTEPIEGGVNPDGTMAVSVPEGRLGKALCGVLRGHAADVSHVRWNAPHKLWVTGSEDHTVRCWTSDGLQRYEIRPPGETSVTALAIDALGFILVGSMDRAVRVYDPETQEPVQQHLGHSDAVRSILHVPEKGQYLTASWDRTIRVWTHHSPPQSWYRHREDVARAEAAEAAEAMGEEGDEEGGAPGDAPAAVGGGGATDDEEMDDEAAAEEGGATGGGDDEEEFIPYSVRYPLIEPKCLADRGKGGGDKFMRKEEKKGKKGGGKEAEEPAKPATGLARELNLLEDRLKAQHLAIERADANADPKRGSRRGAGRVSLERKGGGR